MKRTITDIKREQVATLCERIGKDPENDNTDHEWMIVNSFHRMGWQSSHDCDFDNDAHRYSFKESEKRAARLDRWINRLNTWLKPYGLRIDFAGIFPDMCEASEKGYHKTVIPFD